MKGKQMTSMASPPYGAPSADFSMWDSIDWIAAEKFVQRLQMRIAKAFREKRYGKAKALQWLLTHSFYGKALAVRRVTENRGAKTPGVDGVTWKTSEQKETAVLDLKRQ
jgi:RNA-directed DNA polymerase